MAFSETASWVRSRRHVDDVGLGRRPEDGRDEAATIETVISIQ